MAKNVKRIILSEKQPNNKHIAWAQPSGDNIDLKIFEDNKWKPISGSSTTNKYTSDPNAPMLSMENFFKGATFEAATKLGFDTNSVLTSEQMEQILNELKSYKFATPKQGNAVLVDYDLDNRIFTFQCDDGSIITFTSDHGDTFITGLRPDIDGYIIWKTTRDKLPVRETDPEEPNPGNIEAKSVKSGPSLKVSGSGSTGEVYTVINNNTGEIVDPLELHKLTNIIWYWNKGYLPLYVSNATDVNSINPRDLVALYANALPISKWVPLNTISKVEHAITFYDYTVILSKQESLG